MQNNTSYSEKIDAKLKKAFEQEKKSFVGFFIKNYRFTYLILFTIIIIGLFSVLTLPKEAEPEIRVPFAVVTTIYPGANPTDIEDLITEKLEDKIKNLEDIKLFNSSSGQGISSIFVEYEAEAELKESFRKLREAIDDAKTELPDTSESPVVTEVNFNDMPIVTYSLAGDYANEELKKFADDLKDIFEDINDVSRVEILGGLEREFQIIANQKKLANFNISLGQIVGAIQANNFSLPAGNIEIDNFEYGVRIDGRINSAFELNDIVVATFNNTPIYLKDVAEIKDTYKKRTTESYIGFFNQKSKNTVSLQIYKKTGGNILNIVSDSQVKINELKNSQTLPESLIIQKTNDNSVFIKEDLETLGASGLQTIILIALILMLILSLEGALITAMALPFAFFLSFIFLKMQGMTLNSMVLFSLVLSLGLMVDNAIIIIEGINEYINKHKKSVFEAALLSVWNFKWAITAGTMTTVSAFLPMLLVSGIMGEYMSIMPKTISVTLCSSLFVAIVIIPTLAVRFIKVSGNNGHGQRNKKRHIYLEKKMSKLHAYYIKLLKNILPNKKKRRSILAVSWVLLILAIAAPASGLMKIEMFPDIDLDYFIVNIKLPNGSTLDATRPIARQAEKIIAQIPEVDNYVTTLGVSASLGFHGGMNSSPHLANITVNLKNKKDREKKSYEIADELRSKILISGADVTIEELSAGPPTGSPIEVRIFGDNMEGLSILASDVKKYFKNINGVINVKDNLADSAGEFTFKINKQKADFYGLSAPAIANNLRSALYGSVGSEVNIESEDVDITVKYEDDIFSSIDDINNLLILTPKGEQIALSQVADVSLEPALLTIDHRDGEKIAIVSADLKADADLKNILSDFEEFQKTLTLPENFNIKIGGEVEDIQKSFTELFMSMILSVLLISVILVLQFNSFKQPFLIIFSVPLAFIGVIIGLNALGQPFSFTVFIGLVSLSGIVVNDSIVLIDRINKNIKDGMEFFEAIIEGGTARMQPIFLTSITTIAGVFPLLYASELWRGLSLTIIFGLLFSTILTLVIIPVYYAGICGDKRK